MRRPRLSYANVISTLALFVALGGTSYAVSQLPRNSVGAKQLKRNAVTSAKIRARAVQRSDLAPSARIGSRGARGPAGPAGPLGPSETIQVSKRDSVPLALGAGAPTTLATITVGPGSWLFNAQTRIVAGGASDYFDCWLSTPASTERLGEGTLRIGTDTATVNAGSIPSQYAMTLSSPTQVTYMCSHPAAVGGAPYAERTVLLATRVGSLENR